MQLLNRGMYTICFDVAKRVFEHLFGHRCDGPPVLTTPTFTCQNGQKIHGDKVCDGNSDCLDGSDEQKCKGGRAIQSYITMVVIIYFFLGIVAVGVTLFYLNGQENVPDLQTTTGGPPTSQSCNQISIPNEYIERDIVQVFLVKRSIVSDLTEDEKAILRGHYLNMRDRHQIHLLFCLLKTCGDPDTCRLVIKFLETVEFEVINESKTEYIEAADEATTGEAKTEEKMEEKTKEKVKQFWAKSMSGCYQVGGHTPKYQLLHVQKWVLDHLDEDPGCFDGNGSLFYTYCLPLHSTWEYFEDKLLPPLLGFYRMGSVMLDLWKDLVFFFALQYTASFQKVSINSFTLASAWNLWSKAKYCFEYRRELMNMADPK